jgi:hypothetical protein
MYGNCSAPSALGVFYSLRRPKGSQTSFYQPVRLGKLQRTFVTGQIQSIGFSVTNDAYLRELESVNVGAIPGGYVSAERV